MTLQEELERLGLSEKEAKVYLAALELGSSPVQNIAQKAGMPRPTVYTQIEGLKNLGLITTVERGKKTYFAAEPPHQLDLLLRRQEDELNVQRDRLIKVLPEFEAIFNSAAEKSIVKFYEGKEGLAAMREELLKNEQNKTFLSFTALDDYLAGLPDFEKEQSERRARQQIPIKIIYTYSQGKFNWQEGMLREIRYLPFNKFPFSVSLSISPSVGVQITKYRDGYMGVNILNKELSNTLASVFNLCWEAAEKYN